jgi:hypothetical protein
MGSARRKGFVRFSCNATFKGQLCLILFSNIVAYSKPNVCHYICVYNVLCFDIGGIQIASELYRCQQMLSHVACST